MHAELCRQRRILHLDLLPGSSRKAYTPRMKAVLVQPPFTQLNAPYPAVHYLEAFLRGRGHEAKSFDHGITLYRSIFSHDGLARLFADAPLKIEMLAERRAEELADPAIRGEIDRYLSYRNLYAEWIDPIVDFLSGGDPAFAHRLAQAVELPRGARTAAFLESAGGRIASDESRALATLILEDLGDFMTRIFDPEFGTVRYGERIAASRGDFAEIRSALASSYLLSTFYRPFLRDFWRNPESSDADMILVSIPFPGCLLGALACAEEARKALGPSIPILFGGGYVSTELRALCDPGIFDYCDYLCFDAGYGSITSILEARGFEAEKGEPGGLYRCMHRLEDGRIAVAGFPPDYESLPVVLPLARMTLQCRGAARYAEVERSAITSVYPDYASVDFHSYLGVVDSANPMHRLWSDAPWLKYHLAHGCYWRRCTFCDTELDYVANFVRGDTTSLLRAAAVAAEHSGLTGLHFVDEAMPMGDLLAFAAANRLRASTGKKAFHFWGNVRFDSSWTEGRCAFLAASGLIAVSGGIEVATERGLEMTDKGFDLAGLVRCLVAMKRSGILVHAYLIYGFPEQDEADIVDSAEFCRQLFAAGLIDSAFWHRFVLTRHSRMYGEWKGGALPGLRPLDAPRLFADNDLAFEGEEKFDRFEAPLAAALEAWMAGEELEKPAASWFAKGSRGRNLRSSTPPGLVESLIAQAEAILDERGIKGSDIVHWVAGMPFLLPVPEEAGAPSMASLAWAYRGELEEIVLKNDEAEMLRAAISELEHSRSGQALASFAAAAFVDPKGTETGLVLKRLADSGLAAI
jgi:radical SAM superfamily enzyme YgiQ (UPF0313 family)